MVKGRYHLVQESKIDKERIYFNFTAMQFYDYSESENIGVSLATIDRLTTQYYGQEDFIEHLRKSGYDPDVATMFISYIITKKDKDESIKVEQKLSPVFNDRFLYRVAHSTKDKQEGTIDTDKAFISDKLYEMFKILIVPNNGLYQRIDKKVRENSNTYGINEHNYYFLECLPEKVYDGQVADEAFWFNKFKHNFSSYKEFRGLYLNYGRYKSQFLTAAYGLTPSQEQEKGIALTYPHFKRKTNNSTQE